MSDEAERYKRIANECLGAFDSAKVLTADEKVRELLRENADLRLALAELLRLSAPPYGRTMGEYAEWCAAKGVAHSLLTTVGTPERILREDTNK